MKTGLFIIKLIYYLILTSALVYLGLFPADDYWNLISTVFFGLIGIGYLKKIITKSISVDQLMKHGLVYFVTGTIISTIGIFVTGELFLKLSFLVFVLGIIGTFIDYKKHK